MRPALAAVIRGYFVALVAGNLAFWVIGLIRVAVFGPHPGDEVGVAGLLVVAVFTFIVSIVTTILPFVVFLAISLTLRIRTWAYFVVCGSAMGFLTTGVLIGARWMEWRMWALNASLWQHLCVSGALGGLAYWWVAVRDLGSAAPPRDTGR